MFPKVPWRVEVDGLTLVDAEGRVLGKAASTELAKWFQSLPVWIKLYFDEAEHRNHPPKVAHCPQLLRRTWQREMVALGAKCGRLTSGLAFSLRFWHVASETGMNWPLLASPLRPQWQAALVAPISMLKVQRIAVRYSR